MVEMYQNFQSDNGSLTDQHALRQWSHLYVRSLEDIKDLRIGRSLKPLLEAAGFTEVDASLQFLPASGWSRGK